MLGKHGVEHVDHELLFGLGQLGDAVHLLLQLGCWPALLGGGGRRGADQILDGDREGLRKHGQRGDRHAAVAHLVGVHRLLRDIQRLGELDLGDVLFLAQLRNARAQGLEKRAVVLADGHGGALDNGCVRASPMPRARTLRM